MADRLVQAAGEGDLSFVKEHFASFTGVDQFFNISADPFTGAPEMPLKSYDPVSVRGSTAYAAAYNGRDDVAMYLAAEGCTDTRYGLLTGSVFTTPELRGRIIRACCEMGDHAALAKALAQAAYRCEPVWTKDDTSTRMRDLHFAFMVELLDAGAKDSDEDGTALDLCNEPAVISELLARGVYDEAAIRDAINDRVCEAKPCVEVLRLLRGYLNQTRV